MPLFKRVASTYLGYQNSYPDYAILDVNGDGKLDFILAHGKVLEDVVLPLSFLLGDGAGNFADGTATLFPGGAPALVTARQLIVGEYNGDGRPDLFVVTHGYDVSPYPGGQNRLILSSGPHDVIDASGTLPQVNDFTHSVTQGDIDGDGDTDLLVMNISGGTPSSGTATDPYFLVNDGAGHFNRRSDMLPPDIVLRDYGNKYTSCLLFDADGDGDLDLFLGSHGETNTNYSLMLYNDGTGDFSAAVRVNLPSPQPFGQNGWPATDASVTDIDGNGRLDLVINYGAFTQILVNDGAGGWRDESFRMPPVTDTDQVGHRRIRLVDFNGDGFIDISGTSGERPLLYLNDGTGHFVGVAESLLFDLSGYFGVHWTVAFLPADVNGDGRMDMVVDVGDNNSTHEFTIFTFLQQDPGLSQTGTAEADALLGDDSNEVLSGLGGDDVILAGAGNDRLEGGDGNDYLNGGEGDDILNGGAGEDRLFGFNGNDTISYDGNVGGVFVNLTLERGYGNASFGDTYDSIENVIGTDYNDFIIGDPGTNRLDGAGGDDTIIGAVGPDEIIGGTGLDWASYEDNSGTVFVNLTLRQGFNNAAHGDTYDGIENLIGGLMDDFFIGDEGANRLNGAMGADTLLGAGGADIFMFTYAPGATSTWGNPNVDLILDFTTGVDRIELSAGAFPGLAAGALPAAAFHAGTAAHDGDDRIVYDAASGKLWFDPDGNGAQAAMLFATLGETSHPAAIAASDFVVV